jgi:hypothetical protein
MGYKEFIWKLRAYLNKYYERMKKIIYNYVINLVKIFIYKIYIFTIYLYNFKKIYYI